MCPQILLYVCPPHILAPNNTEVFLWYANFQVLVHMCPRTTYVSSDTTICVSSCTTLPTMLRYLWYANVPLVYLWYTSGTPEVPEVYQSGTEVYLWYANVPLVYLWYANFLVVLYICPHTTYVSSYTNIYVSSHANICVLVYCYICVLIDCDCYICVLVYYYMCVLVHCYVCVLIDCDCYLCVLTC
jgi:hypothetical protein